jgi:multidrug resistance efflux pump
VNEPNVNHTPPESAARPADASLRDRVKSLRLPDRPHTQRSPLAVVPWVLCVILLGTTVALAMRSPQVNVDASEELSRLMELQKTPGRPASSSLRPGDVVLESKGYIVPIHQIQVSPKVSGMVMSLRIEEGMVVKKDDILAELETVEYLSDRDTARAQMEASRNRWQDLALSLEHQIKQAQHDLEDAKAQYDNEYVQLQSEIASREGTSPVDVLKRKATVEAKMARVNWQKNQVEMINKGSLAHKMDAARADFEQFQASLVKAEWRLSNCVVKAPVTGIILVKRAEEGSLVNPSAFSNGLSASLCDMADLAELEVDLAIPERDVARLVDFKLKHKNPQFCQVRADAFPNRAYEGFVSRIMPTADQSKAAVPVRVKIVIPVSEAGVYLRPQMNAAVTFLNQESTAR